MTLSLTLESHCDVISGSQNSETDSCIAKISASFCRLRTTVWERRWIKVTTKIKVYKAIVLTTLLYDYSRHAGTPQHFLTTRLRRVLGIKWKQKIPDTEVPERANNSLIPTLFQRNHLRWAGNLHRMHDNRIPKQLFYGELTKGRRAAGGQRKRYKDVVKSALKAVNIDWKTWVSHANMRPVWRSMIDLGCKSAEVAHTLSAQEKRAARTARTANVTVSNLNRSDILCIVSYRNHYQRYTVLFLT
jgi:hypothetical protein